MNAIQAIEHRRSVKHYDPTHVMPESDLQQLLHLARLAPTSFNIQNYRFLVVRDKEVRKQIRAAAWDQAQVTDASALIVLCADLNAHKDNPARYWQHVPAAVRDFMVSHVTPFYEGRDQLIRDEAIRSSAFAGMSIMLAAPELGYESGPMIGFDPVAVAKIINLPANYVISFLLVVGKPLKVAWPRGERLPESEVVHYDRFPN
jgi:nitroreductase